MKNIIQKYVETAFKDLETSIKKMQKCELETFYFGGDHTPEYDKIEHQQEYILKYFPAYLAEYYYIYKELNFNNFFNPVNQDIHVLSLGCGSGVDLLAFYLRRLSVVDFKYTVIDLANWKYRDLIIPASDKINFINANAADFNFKNYEDINLIIFPRSISEFDDNVIDSIVKNIQSINLTSKRIAIAILCRNKGFQKDQEKYKKIIEAIKQQNYDYIQENPNKGSYLPIQELPNQGICCYVSEFQYPQNIKDNLSSLKKLCADKFNCTEDCCLDYNPILKTKDFSFSLNILEKH